MLVVIYANLVASAEAMRRRTKQCQCVEEIGGKAKVTLLRQGYGGRERQKLKGNLGIEEWRNCVPTYAKATVGAAGVRVFVC